MESCKIEKQALALHHPGEEFTFINFEIQAILSLTDQVALTTVKITLLSKCHPFKQMVLELDRILHICMLERAGFLVSSIDRSPSTHSKCTGSKKNVFFFRA